MKLTEKNITILKTCNIYAFCITLGLCLAIPGPTLIDLQNVVKTDLRNIAYIFPVRSMGSAIGSLIAGIILDMISQRQVPFLISNLLLSICMFGISWSRELQTLIVWMTLMGLFVGFLSTSGLAYILELWGKKGARHLQAFNFMYSVGGFVAPLLASPFLSSYNETVNLNKSKAINISETVEQNFSLAVLYTSNTDEEALIPPIAIPYMIIGAFSLIVTLFFSITCIIAPNEKNQQKRTKPVPLNGKHVKTYFIVLFVVLFIVATHGMDVSYNQLLTTYALKASLNLSTTIGSYMTSTFYAAAIISKFSAVFLSIKIKSLYYLILQMFITFLGSLTLLVLSEYHAWALWLSSILLGYGLGPLFPTCVSWIERYITVTNKITSLFSLGFIAGSMVMPYAILYYVEGNPQALSYANITNFGIGFGIIFILYLIVRPMPDKYTLQEKVTHSASENNF